MSAKKAVKTTKKTGPRGINAAWFREMFADVKLSQNEVAPLIKLDGPALSRTLKGERKLQLTEAHELAKVLGVNMQEVLRNAGLEMGGSSSRPEARVVGWVDSAGAADINWSAAGEFVDAPPDLPAGAVAVQVRASGPAFTPMDGWLLFTVAPPRGVDPEAVGRLALCKVRGGPHLVRHVKRGYKRGTFSLVAETGEVTADADLEFATPVSWIRVA